MTGYENDFRIGEQIIKKWRNYFYLYVESKKYLSLFVQLIKCDESDFILCAHKYVLISRFSDIIFGIFRD